MSWTAGSKRDVTPMMLTAEKESLLQPSMFTEEQIKAAYDIARKWGLQFSYEKVFFLLHFFILTLTLTVFVKNANTRFISIRCFEEVKAFVYALGLKVYWIYWDLGCGDMFLAMVISILTKQVVLCTEATDSIHR